MRSLTTIFVLLILFSGSRLTAQSLSFTEAIKLPNAINSVHEESNLFVSDDNSILIFSRSANKQSDKATELYFGTKNDDDKWSYVMPFPQNDANGADELRVVGMTESRKHYFIENLASKKPKLYVQRCGNEFCQYHLDRVDIKIKGKKLQDIYVHPDDSVMLFSMMPDNDVNQGQEDIYVSLKNSKGVWSEPKNLGVTLNSDQSEITPYLSHDKKRLFFASTRDESIGGYDIFYTDRLYDSWILWTVPRRLDDAINTTANETSFFINDNAAYFMRDQNGDNDIFQSQKEDYFPVSAEGEGQ
uniref:WD40-like Beta Propeller Repeat n=1 Tax=Roseihalotalea indica TaxID=2867963 RepID=A0AA49GJR6_9BACT|nr:hypothetical protein K4G66_24335 [Tunicatimonas sp. TK19036]